VARGQPEYVSTVKDANEPDWGTEKEETSTWMA
jgi:hypothetical protein